MNTINEELCEKYKRIIKKLNTNHNPKYSYMSVYYTYMYNILRCDK